MSRTQTEGKRRTPSRRAFNQRCAVRVTYNGNTVEGQRNLMAGMSNRMPLLDEWQKAGDERIWKIIVSPDEVTNSSGTAGRPHLPLRIFHVQKRQNALRCHATTVSGFAMTSDERQFA